MIKNQEKFIRNQCSKCKNTNKDECNIVQKINGEYDCVNKKVEKEQINESTTNYNKK